MSSYASILLRTLKLLGTPILLNDCLLCFDNDKSRDLAEVTSDHGKLTVAISLT
jgi:hypothetical protein